MNRKDAEEKFGNAIYDKFKVPEEIQNLKILLIENWNVNACAKEHTKTTGEVGKIQITKCKFRNGKGQLEVSFLVE
jgi:alanyl-tRNA synthetase